jgi:aspartate/glutamate racemase
MLMIGMLGGMSWESSAQYYRLANELVRERLGDLHSARCLLYSDRLASRGLTVLVPEADDRALVHSVIYDELCRGIITEPSRVAYIEIIHRLAASGAQGVILGCTEIELLISQDDSPIPVFPTTRLHVEAAVTQSLADEGLSGSPSR